MKFINVLLAGMIACVLIVSAAMSMDGPVLFKNFKYGMSRADVQQICKTETSDEEGAEDLLFASEPVKFANFDWNEAFKFNKADRLTQVLLIREEFSPEAYAALLKGIASNDYMIASMADGSSTFDFAAFVKENKNPEEVKNAVNRFESNALQNDKPLVLLLAPKAYLRKLIAEGKPFSGSLISAPDELRLVEVNVKDGSLGAAFITPVIDIRKSTEGIKENF